MKELLSFLLGPTGPRYYSPIIYTLLEKLTSNGNGPFEPIRTQYTLLVQYLLRDDNVFVEFIVRLILKDPSGGGEGVIIELLSKLRAEDEFAGGAALRALLRSSNNSIQMRKAIGDYAARMKATGNGERLAAMAERVLRREED
ncbi:MAG TPA: hypothetical protein VFC90_13715 [Planctomycetota bacterium]|nr:hypothetical protein [Planctomycetota bacterium]